MKFRLICTIMSVMLLLCSCSYANKANTSTVSNDSVSNETKVLDTMEPENPKETPTVVNTPEVTQPSADSPSLNKTKKEWYYVVKKNGEPSGEPGDILNLINKYSGYYLGDTAQKELYLTFDEGYENGYSSKILDILKENNVKAAFFVTKPYIAGNKELIKRMVNEGHLVCNHSNTHPSMPNVALKGQTAFDKEFTDTEKAFTEVTGKTMPKFFRPPMGNYSELSLYYTQALGYKTIFWSFAYRDWEIDKQPTENYAVNLLRERTHNGGIVLLHAVSKTNTNILDSMLKEWKGKGYEFKTLHSLPEK